MFLSGPMCHPHTYTFTDPAEITDVKLAGPQQWRYLEREHLHNRNVTVESDLTAENTDATEN